MEDLLAALAERARASNGATAANNQDATATDDSRAPSGDIAAAAQQSIGDLPSAAQLGEGAPFLAPSC